MQFSFCLIYFLIGKMEKNAQGCEPSSMSVVQIDSSALSIIQPGSKMDEKSCTVHRSRSPDNTAGPTPLQGSTERSKSPQGPIRKAGQYEGTLGLSWDGKSMLHLRQEATASGFQYSLRCGVHSSFSKSNYSVCIQRINKAFSDILSYIIQIISSF